MTYLKYKKPFGGIHYRLHFLSTNILRLINLSIYIFHKILFNSFMLSKITYLQSNYH